MDALEANDCSICSKTLWSFTDRLEKSGLACEIFESVTIQMAKSHDVTLLSDGNVMESQKAAVEIVLRQAA
jgi:hypothetical protein